MSEILLVQSNPTRTVEIRILLERKAHAVTHASNGRDAIQALRQGKIDLVVSDLALKVMSGSEFVRGVQVHFSDVRVMFIAPAGGEQLADEALRAGAVACVSDEQPEGLLIDTVETIFRVTFGNDPYGPLLARLQSNSFDFDLPNDPRLFSPITASGYPIHFGKRYVT